MAALLSILSSKANGDTNKMPVWYVIIFLHVGMGILQPSEQSQIMEGTWRLESYCVGFCHLLYGVYGMFWLSSEVDLA